MSADMTVWFDEFRPGKWQAQPSDQERKDMQVWLEGSPGFSVS
jgi:hypothetical protein